MILPIPSKKLFPEVKSIKTYEDCEHIAKYKDVTVLISEEEEISFSAYIKDHTLAHADSKSKEICVVSENLIETPSGDIHNVLWHEYAHILEQHGNSWHGKEWRKRLEEIGKSYLIKRATIPTYDLLNYFRANPVEYHNWLGGNV